jgi:uncharacterized protein (DUF1684 family)
LSYFSDYFCPARATWDPVYVQEIDAWHQKRIANLTKPDGWLTLTGLFWLKEGENRFGSDQSNDVVFPAGKAPAFMGSIFLDRGLTSVTINPGVQVNIVDSTAITKAVLYSDANGKATVLEHGSLRWFIIKRGEKWGVRLRDRDNPARLQFKGIKRFPVDPTWRVTARFEPYQPVKTIPIVNVLGVVENMSCPGSLRFTLQNKEYRLDALAESNESQLFIIFRDETSGQETYGSGRFLYAEKPNENNETFLDFNKAYNPPCAFTHFATCPLPPKQNELTLAIRAGEKSYH